ncbi:MAG: hypothetical protein ABWY04_08405 [Arthrobacter sp.]
MSISKATAARPPFAQRRQSAGIPEGGQFAATAHAEPSIALGSEDTTGRLAEYTNGRDFAALAYSSAEYWRGKYNQKGKSQTWDTDDIAQETMLRVLKEVNSGKPITDFKQLVNSVAANVTVRATANKFSAEDRRAYRIFDAARQEFEATEGRTMTQREEDALAQKVLDEWHDPRHKPSKDFRTPHTVDTSLDRTFNEGDGVESTLGATLVNPASSGHYIEPDSYMDKAFSALEETGAAHKAAAKRMAWNAIAERAEVPMAREGSLSQRQVTNLRKVMSAHKGGVMQAVQDWSDAKDNPATEALFAPFGPLSADGQMKVVDMLELLSTSYGADKADDMWANALAFSNNKHAEAS